MREVSFTVSSTIVVRVEVTPGTEADFQPQHLPEMFGVLGAHLQQKAVLAGDVMNLEDLGHLRQRLGGRLLRPVFVGPDGDKRQQRPIGRCGSMEATYSRIAPRASSLRIRSSTADGASPTALAMSDLGRPGVLLKNHQDFGVNFVQCSVECHNLNYMMTRAFQ